MGVFEMMAMASSGLIILTVPAFALPFLYIYLIHDYSGRRQGMRDPLLGSKVFCTLLMTAAGQLVLAGAAIVAVSLVQEGSSDFMMKTGAGMILAGVLAGAFPAYLYFSRLRGSAGARVGHQALGINALLTGLVFTVMLVVVCQALFHDEDMAEPLAVAVIYGVAMVGAGLRLHRSPIAEARVESDGASPSGSDTEAP